VQYISSVLPPSSPSFLLISLRLSAMACDALQSRGFGTKSQ
jgi:hypothetical protein